jgi:hypothetical protein
VTIGQLAWPIVIIALAILLKEPIKRLTVSPRLTKVKAGPAGIEMEFKEELGEAAKELEQSDSSSAAELAQGDGVAASDFLGEMARLAQVSPRSVVMETHARLQKLLRDSVDVPAGAKRASGYLNMRSLVRTAASQELLSREEVSVLEELTYLRNRVAHEPDQVITSDTALSYAELAMRVAIAVRLALGQAAVEGSPL